MGKAITRGKFEYIPKWLNLIPMVIQWVGLGLKYGSLTLPSSANPHITSGGMVGEGKAEYFDIMGPFAKSLTAPFITIKVDNTLNLKDIETKLSLTNLSYPLVAKPDLGWCGYGVRLIHNENELTQYIDHYPKNEQFLLQKFVHFEGEAGIFYMRSHGHNEGKILGVLLRHYPKVIGNGKDNLSVLIHASSRLKRLLHDTMHNHKLDLTYIPANNEVIRLSLIGSTRVGGLYVDGTNYITPDLTDKMDTICHDMKEFHVGRFDVRFENIDELSRGNFIIMEVNGAGSEAVHAWDPKYTIPQVYNIVFEKQRALFALSHVNRQHGFKPISMIKLAKLYFKQKTLMSQYPLSN